MTVKRIECDVGGKNSVEEYNLKTSDYEVVRREWITSDGHFIREFTIDEYINQDPTCTIVLPYSIDSDRKIESVAYCREYRNYYAKKRGSKVMLFVKVHDYIKP